MSNPTANRNVPPHTYFFDYDDYVEVTMCTHCFTIGWILNCSPHSICRYCGQDTVEKLAKGAKWIPPVYEGWIFRKMIKKGYWELAE